MITSYVISNGGFELKDGDTVVVSQPFNPNTGEPFSSKEETELFIQEHYGFLLGTTQEVTDSIIEELANELVKKVSTLLNAFAQSYRYDSIDSISKYLSIAPVVGSENYDIQVRYKNEAMALANYASECWAYVEATMLKIASTKELINIEDIIANLPKKPNMEL